jgi:VWFA-related protein
MSARLGRLVVAAVGVVVFGAGAAARQSPSIAPSFRSTSTELVVLPVIVTDKQGRFIEDVAREQFAVFDNGRRQDVAFFTSEDAPVSIGLVVDTSGSMGPKMPLVEAAATAFARWSNPDDDIFALAFADGVRDLLPGRTLRAGDPATLQHVLDAVVPAGRTALYDALMTALDRLDMAARARKVLILISDGGDNASRASLKDVLARARKSNASIYTIGLFDERDADRNPDVLKALARLTGGERFLPRSAGPMMQACHQIAHEIRNEYTIGFAPPDRDGRYHVVRVLLSAASARKLVVRTRPGYFAAGAAPGAATPSEPVDDVRPEP